MLGQLLEIALAAEPVAAALEFYRGLGFRDVPVGDIVTTPYAVVTQPGLALALHGRELAGPAPTFVRPELREHLRALKHLGIELDWSTLADDEFHSAAFLDPNGLSVMLIEARTFSPAPSEGALTSVCGDWLELSVATHSCEESASFWSLLGLERVAAGDAPHPWLRMRGHGLTIGFHEKSRFAPGLSFVCDQLAARLEYLEAKGYAADTGAPLSERRKQSATLTGPEGTPLYLLEQAEI